MRAGAHPVPHAAPLQGAVPSVWLRPFARGDAVLFVALSALHGAALLALPLAPLIAFGIWWNSNTIGHTAIHRPFFRSHAANQIFSAYQSVLLGVPQTLWRDRHLAHHAGVEWQLWPSVRLLAETMLVVSLWGALAATVPAFFLLTYLPGYCAGLALCALQGHYEHAAGTTSHYGRLYNLLCFNDGYHVEHHAAPGVRWSELPDRRQPGTHSSRWPALVRWLGETWPLLDGLERVVLRSTTLQRLVLAAHRRACRRLLHGLGPIRRAVIVGGGLFPRTALVLHEIAPAAELILVDASSPNLAAARAYVGRCGAGLRTAVTFHHACFAGEPVGHDIDLLVVPLAYRGDRAALYARPPARAVLVHDWIWRVRGEGCVVSTLLLKRLNLVQR